VCVTVTGSELLECGSISEHCQQIRHADYAAVTNAALIRGRSDDRLQFDEVAFHDWPENNPRTGRSSNAITVAHAEDGGTGLTLSRVGRGRKRRSGPLLAPERLRLPALFASVIPRKSCEMVLEKGEFALTIECDGGIGSL